MNYVKTVEMKSKATKVQMKPITFFAQTHSFIRSAFSNFQNNEKNNEKDLRSPWITGGIKHSSKPNQRLYFKFLKNRKNKNQIEQRNYKNVT